MMRYSLAFLLCLSTATAGELSLAWEWEKQKTAYTSAQFVRDWSECKGGCCNACKCGPDCQCGKGKDCNCTQAKCYGALRALAIRDRKPLVVFVGCEPKRIDGMYVCRFDALPDSKPNTIVVGRPENGELIRGNDIAYPASAEQVRAALATTSYGPTPVSIGSR